jgi:hypothetical protein
MGENQLDYERATRQSDSVPNQPIAKAVLRILVVALVGVVIYQWIATATLREKRHAARQFVASCQPQLAAIPGCTGLAIHSDTGGHLLVMGTVPTYNDYRKVLTVIKACKPRDLVSVSLTIQRPSSQPASGTDAQIIGGAVFPDGKLTLPEYPERQ